ncbi:hypothetical protein Rhopal_002689-T1 [Rhodotorula paludigena]|uniref:Uncharacterized protein n=1 Tax=Rhodotorula paludigena TaxID=86838 RepID=A0AAV5GJS1_9BASI|nr:hypothetical protein Rhopal_002689-T1 [Rhodotorula paludigena]
MISTDGAIYDERGQRASAAPLQPGSVLRPLAGALHPNAVAWPTPGSAAEELQRQATGSPNEQRLVHGGLLRTVKSAEGWRDLTFRLTEPLVHGDGRFSQVWRAAAGVSGQVCRHVVVKFIADALWRPKEDLGPLDWWYSLEDRIKSENHAYSALRPLQGRDVPHCYGSFSFDMPWGEPAVGFVLEDLLQVAEPVENRCKRDAAQLQGIHDWHRLAGPSLRQLQRIFALNVTSTHTDAARNIFVVHNTPTSNPKLVFAGFGRTAPLDKAQRKHEAKYPGHSVAGMDDHWLAGSWARLMGDRTLYYEWKGWARTEEPDLFIEDKPILDSESSGSSDASDGSEE